MKKILIYINQICLRGGVEKVFYNLINNLDLNKYDISILTTVAYLKDDLNIKIYKKPIHRFFLQYDEFSENKLFRLYQRIYNKVAPPIIKCVIKSIKWDTAIAAQEGMYAKFIVKTKADKHLLWIHNDFFVTDWSKKHFHNNRLEEAECYRKFDKIICVSDTVRQSINSTLGLKDNVTVRYNPIDLSEIDKKKEEKVQEKPANRVLFLMIGRLCHQKGYDRLLKIAKRLNEEGFKYDVWILGEGEEKEALLKYISKNNLENVKFLGNKENPFGYMNIADCILSTSRFEGFSTALQEATYMGKAIMTTKCAGAEELLGDSEYGIVIENDDEEIYKAIKKVLQNPEILDIYREKIKCRKEFINLEERVRKIEELL